MITEIADPLPSSLIAYAHNSMGEVNSMTRAQSQYEPNRGNTTPIRKPQLETTIPEDLRKTYLDTFAQLDPLNLKKVDGMHALPAPKPTDQNQARLYQSIWPYRGYHNRRSLLSGNCAIGRYKAI